MKTANDDVKELIREEMRRLGKRGGNATLKKHGPEYFSKLSKKGVKARKRKKTKKTEAH